ncbi:G-protein coupled receptor [Mactra antiquata]
MDCRHNGTLDDVSCTCRCTDNYTGPFCETVKKETRFPRGQYALPATLHGCPEEETMYQWYTGYMNLTLNHSDGVRHYWSDDTNLLGPYHKQTVQMNFCIRLDSIDVLEYDQIWPPGNYCVYGIDEQCPKGFQEGRITLEDYMISSGQFDGKIPITQPGEVTLIYCCNQNNGTLEDIDFGSNQTSFYLFKTQDSTRCPDIKYMMKVEEYFSFRKTSNKTWYTEGVLPAFNEDTVFFNITFCSYKPIARRECMYTVDHGSSYRGTYNMTTNGTCDYWTEVTDLDSRYEGDFEENFCRKLKESDMAPGCYVNGDFNLCDSIPVCEDEGFNGLLNVAYFKPVVSPDGYPYATDGILADGLQFKTQQIVANGVFSQINFKITTPCEEPYFNIDLGLHHEITAVGVYRTIANEVEPDSFWKRMVVWISKQKWDFLTFGALRCGDMLNAYKSATILFRCQRTLVGRYVTIQTNVHSDPDYISNKYLNLQSNEIIVYGKVTTCGRRLGVATGKLERSQVTVTNNGVKFTDIKDMTGPQGWCPTDTAKKPTVKVDLALPMVIEGLIINVYHTDDVTKRSDTQFTISYGFDFKLELPINYTDLTNNTKVFKLSDNVKDVNGEVFLFPEPFVASLVDININQTRGRACYKIDFIVCERSVRLSCTYDRDLKGWKKISDTDFSRDTEILKTERVDNWRGCMEVCTQDLVCESFSFKTNRQCKTSNYVSYPPFMELLEKEGSSITEIFCITEIPILDCNFNITSESIIFSPKYPHAYLGYLNCSWTINIPDTVAILVDVIDFDIRSAEHDTEIIGATITKLDFCSDDVSIIQNGTKKRLQMGKEYVYRGNSLPVINNNTKISFTSCERNDTFERRGFAFKIRRTDCEICTVDRFRTYCQGECGYIMNAHFPIGLYPGVNQEGNTFMYEITGKFYQYLSIIVMYYDAPDDLKLEVKGFSPLDQLILIHRLNQDPYPVLHLITARGRVATAFIRASIHRGYMLKYTLQTSQHFEAVRSIFEQPQQVCEDGWMYFEGSCYYVANFDPGTFDDARQACLNIGADLVKITSMKEQDVVHFYLLSKGNILHQETVVIGTGLKSLYKHRIYKWLDGSRAIFQNWEIPWSTQGRNWKHEYLTFDGCVSIRIFTAQNSASWLHQRCSSNYEFSLCEKNMEHITTKATTREDIIITDTPTNNITKLLYECSNAENIDILSYCDGVTDCADNSDEMSCNRGYTRTCLDNEFECLEKKQCIPIRRYCDFINDCEDMSDEIYCEHPQCSRNEFRCKNGQCINYFERCDLKNDCYDESDEQNCETVDCVTNEKLFLCKHETQCIPMSRVCDGFIDCPGNLKSDEGACDQHLVKATCQEWYADGFTQSGTYYIHLGHESDDTVRYRVECEFNPESGTISTVFHHKNQAAIPTTDQDDLRMLKYHFKTASCKCLVSDNEWLETPRSVWYSDAIYFNNPPMLPLLGVITRRLTVSYGHTTVAVGPLICNASIPALNKVIKCNTGSVVPLHHRCLYNIDKYGYATGCRDNTHLLNCETWTCPSGYAKCPNDFCIPLEFMCDGKMDCRHGEDEMNCDAWFCPKQFRCRDSATCIMKSKLCDGVKDCQYGEDEFDCDIQCSGMCKCGPGFVECTGQSVPSNLVESSANFSPDVRTIVLKHSYLYLTEMKSSPFERFPYLGKLDLSFCRIKEIHDLTFKKLHNLYYLDLGYNKLSSISSFLFQDLNNLRYLNLAGNLALQTVQPNAFVNLNRLPRLDLQDLSISIITEDMFRGLPSLEILNLSGNAISQASDYSFSSLRKLRILDLSNNMISSFDKSLFIGLDNLDELVTDSFSFCCIKPVNLSLSKCFPSQDEFSSCSDLLRSGIVRACLWFIGAFAFFGNIMSFVFRVMSERGSLQSGYGVLVTNLSVADMMMGLYLLIISSADSFYRDRYIWNDYSWRHSSGCKIAGILGMLSSECSVLILTLITFDRFKSIKFNSGFTQSASISLCSLAWFLSIIFAVLPVLPSDALTEYFGKSFYSVSGVCLTLPITSNRIRGFGYSVGTLIVFNFVCFLFIGVVQTIVYVTVRRTKLMLEKPDRRVEFQIAKRLSTVVITDFLAWIPICGLGILALMGGEVSGVVYTWIAVFVFPFNSALNPIIYTYSSFSNSELGRKIMERLGFKTARFSTQNQVSYYKNKVHGMYRAGGVALCPQKNHEQIRQVFSGDRSVTLLTVFDITCHMISVLDEMHAGNLSVSRFNEYHVTVLLKGTQYVNKIVIRGIPRASQNEADKAANIYDVGQVVAWMLKRFNVQKLRKPEKIIDK